MRLKYIFYGINRDVHPSYVKSDLNPLVQPSVALDRVVYKRTRFKEKSILDVKTHFKKNGNLPVHTFHLLSTAPLSVKKGFLKGEALRILRTNSSKTTLEENISNSKKRLIDRGYPQTMIENLNKNKIKLDMLS